MIASGIINWMRIESPDTKYKPVYSVDLVVDKAESKRLKGLGLTLKKNKEGQEYIKFKRDVSWPSGDPKAKPKVFDKDGNILSVLVGNGSEGEIQFQIIEGKNKFGEYKKVDLQAVKISKLIAFGGSVSADGAEFGFEEEEEDSPF